MSLRGLTRMMGCVNLGYAAGILVGALVSPEPLSATTTLLGAANAACAWVLFKQSETG